MDKKIINLIKEKDEQAFEQLYDEYKNLVYYVIYQIVRESDAANTLLQDTFLTVYNKIDQYSGGNFKYWLLTIAKNLSKNYCTRTMNKQKNIVVDDTKVLDTPDKDYTSLGKYDEILSENFNQEEKDIIVYHVVFGYKFKEIALLMDKSAKYISLKYKLLLETLKSIMEEQ